MAGPVPPLVGVAVPAPPAPLVAVTIGDTVAAPVLPLVPPVAVAVPVASPDVETPDVVELFPVVPEVPPAPVPPLVDAPEPSACPLPPVGPAAAGATVVGVTAGAGSLLRVAASARTPSSPDMAADGTSRTTAPQPSPQGRTKGINGRSGPSRRVGDGPLVGCSVGRFAPNGWTEQRGNGGFGTPVQISGSKGPVRARLRCGAACRTPPPPRGPRAASNRLGRRRRGTGPGPRPTSALEHLDRGARVWCCPRARGCSPRVRTVSTSTSGRPGPGESPARCWSGCTVGRSSSAAGATSTGPGWPPEATR